MTVKANTAGDWVTLRYDAAEDQGEAMARDGGPGGGRAA